MCVRTFLFKYKIFFWGIISRQKKIEYCLTKDNVLLYESITLTKKRIDDISSIRDSPLFKFIDEIFKDSAINESSFQSIIITGPPRVGKSIIANTLSNNIGHYILNTDIIRKLYWEEKNDTKRQYLRKKIFSKILGLYPRGLIIEGDEFISRNRSATGNLKPFSLDLLDYLKKQYKIEVFIIGNKTATIDKKVNAMQSFRDQGKCWTLKNEAYFEDETIPALAEHIIKVSQNLSLMAKDKKLEYYDIHPEKFNKDIENTVSTIISKLI